MSSSMWVLDKDLCRCCHAEGAFCSLGQSYSQVGREEVYSEIMKDCFNIEIHPTQGQLYPLTHKICKACILRLKDAYHFKRQVLDCEAKFMDMYRKGVIKVLDDGLNAVVKEETSDTSIDFSLLGSDDVDDDDVDDDFDLKDDQEELDLLKVDMKKASQIKSKPASKAKPKPPARAKARKGVGSKEEGTGEAQPSQQKKKGSETEHRTFTKTLEQYGTYSYTCNSCQRVFKKRNNFTQHYNHVHLKLRPKLRSCHMCPVKVPGYMRRFHMEEAHGLPAPACGACGKKFAYPFQVLRHQKLFHMSEKKFSCTSCDMKFATKYDLSVHEKKHSPTRPFQCDFCEKRFRWKNNLRTHVMIHLEVKKFVCSVCHEAFVQSSSLKYHVTKRHPEMV